MSFLSHFQVTLAPYVVAGERAEAPRARSGKGNPGPLRGEPGRGAEISWC
jgi:hypothetical protein